MLLIIIINKNGIVMPKKSRKTRQKEQIEAAAEAFGRFFTADELHERISRDGRIGIATVYRSLKSLNRRGKLHCYVCGKRRIYSKDKSSHCHFICRKCGRIAHFEPGKIDFISGMDIGQPCHFQLDVHGVCRACLEKGR